MPREVIAMKHPLVIFLIGVCCFLFGCEQYEATKHYKLGVDFAKRREFSGAISEYQKALAINPNYADAHCKLGVAYRYQGKLDEAIASYQKAIAIEPDYVKAHNNLGYAYSKQGKYDLAIESHQKAISIKPDYAAAHYNLAHAYSLKGEKNLSMESLQKAISLDRSIDRSVIEATKMDSDFDNIRFISFVPLILGSFVLLIGIGKLIRAIASEKWPTVEGIVISSEIDLEGDGRRASGSDIHYEYWVQGERFSANTIHPSKWEISSNSYHQRIVSLYPLGSKVIVYYHPQKPNIAVLEPWISLEILCILGAGVVLMCIGIVGLFDMTPHLTLTDIMK